MNNNEDCNEEPSKLFQIAMVVLPPVLTILAEKAFSEASAFFKRKRLARKVQKSINQEKENFINDDEENNESG